MTNDIVALSPEVRDDKQDAFRLVFHIGAGKTGTSSIQESLRLSQDILHKHGICYWGLMLESAPVKLYSWQVASASKEFLALAPEQARGQVEEVILKSIRVALAGGCRMAIWSNEWFFGRHHAVLPALKAIEAKGIDVQIVAYVRRHDAWARSAYVQWGLKHKTYDGPLIGFAEYTRKRPVRFAGTLSPWSQAFPKSFVLRNFDAIGDVVNDFSMLLALPKDIRSVRTNETPSMEELLLRSLYNDTVKKEALPLNFDQVFGAKQIDFDLAPSKWLESLLPTDTDLHDLIQLSGEDRELTNSMLRSSGQPEIQTQPLKARPVTLDADKMIAILFQIMMVQSQKIQKLQRDVRQLTEAAGDVEETK